MRTTRGRSREALKYISITGVLLVISVLVFSLSRKVYAQSDDPTLQNATNLIAQGKQIFRFDTFGDETFWGDVLKLHQAIEGSRFGGVGGGVSPKMALTLGLKVDAAALPSDLVASVKAGQVDLDDPSVRLLLFELNSVVGVTVF